MSTNLIHWTELPPAFREDYRFGGGVQSGGSVLDRENSSGLSPDSRTPPLVAFWSGNDNRSTCISYSLDKGRTWTKYSGNPVLNLNLADFRDPHVFWADQARRWVMAIALPNDHKVLFYGSPDLKAWERLSEFVGNFDGSRFTNDRADVAFPKES